ncbi:PGPGW domain-containing protein [Nocardioides plantarum]|uniref:PGPGW domain-containing protein n=1 Tax=Nocardioides plantarum TaxID=29299 RepID=A0ABV5KFW4_9ACTN|nr:PGPGW domain-containing protein [Nocardioides plantarum]
MKVAKRIGLEVVGWLLLVAGVAALVLPGPGLIMVFAGLAVLSQQYEWAERRLDPIKYRALKGAAESVETPTRIALSAAGVLFLIGCGVLWIVGPDQPGWWPLPDWTWLTGGIGTGSTLLFSALIAIALLVYSFRRFYGKPDAVAELEGDIEEADRDFKALSADD